MKIITIILVLCCVGLIIAYQIKAKQILKLNTATLDKNDRIQLRNQELTIENSRLLAIHLEEALKLLGTKTALEVQNNILSSIKKTNEELLSRAEEQAETVYLERLNLIQERLAQDSERLNLEYKQLEARLEERQKDIADLEAKLLAYILAQQRAEEMETNSDYYRLVLGANDLSEVTMLRDLLLHFSHKEAIDKLIWETYYKIPYNILMSHLFDSADKVCGIYKITNMKNGLIYIGLSVDSKERIRLHIKTALSSAPSTNKLYQLMKKCGPENFTFEVLEKIERAKLNEREAYWIDFYKTKDFGMNGTRGNINE